MADFGEYLPYAEDVAFWDGDDGTEWHNKFSERWANLNMQVPYVYIHISLPFTTCFLFGEYFDN
jgi:hypothetical protein